MRHGKKFNHLSRTASHRNAMLANMASSLIVNKRISTTVAKAKALRKYVEPLLTKSKEDTTHSRRTVFSYLQNKESVHELYNEVAPKIASRPGGYTRIIKLSNRLGDDAELAIIELVDYNENLLGEKKEKKKTTRRSRRGSGSKTQSAAKTEEKKVEEPKEEKPKAEAKAEKKEEPKKESDSKADKADDKKEDQ